MRSFLGKSELHNMLRLGVDPQYPHSRANFGMNLITLVIITNLYGLALVKSEESPYNVTRFGTSPGIYYEQLPNIRLYNDELNVKIYRNESIFSSQLEYLKEFKEKYLKNCQNPASPCSSNDTESIRNDLKNQIEELKSQKATTTGNRVDLNERQKGNSFYVTHACRQESPDNRIHIIEEYPDDCCPDDISFLKDKIHFLVDYSDPNQTIEMSSRIKSFLDDPCKMQTAVRAYERDLINFVDAVVYARKGKIHPEFEPRKNISSCIEQIHSKDQLHQQFLDQSKDLYTKEEMMRLSKVDVAYENSILIYTTSIPLLDNDTFSLFRIHPVPVKQDHDDSGNKFVFIRPSDEYIAISKNRSFSKAFSEDFFKHCDLRNDTYVCRQDQPLLYSDETESKSCEMAWLQHELLHSNYTTPHDLLHLCDLMLISFDGMYSSALQTPNSWIFVSSTSQTLTITCPGSNEILSVPLPDAGVLQLKNGCAAKYSGTATVPYSSSTSSDVNSTFRLKLTEVKEFEGVDLSSDSYPYLNKPLNAVRLKIKGLLLNEMIREAKEFDKRISPIVNRLWRMIIFSVLVSIAFLLILVGIIIIIVRRMRPHRAERSEVGLDSEIILVNIINTDL